LAAWAVSNRLPSRAEWADIAYQAMLSVNYSA
jgi:hypothetical protein